MQEKVGKSFFYPLFLWVLSYCTHVVPWEDEPIILEERFDQGMQMVATGKWSKALKVFQTIVDEAESDSLEYIVFMSRYELAYIYYRKGDFDRALEIVESLLKDILVPVKVRVLSENLRYKLIKRDNKTRIFSSANRG